MIEAVTVEHPRAAELRRIYEGLLIPAKVVQGEEPVIIIQLLSDKGTFELRSGKSLLEYYHLLSTYLMTYYQQERYLQK